MEYVELTDAHRETLRRERVLALESDHYRAELCITEGGDDAEALTAKCAELERRIGVHAAEKS